MSLPILNKKTFAVKKNGPKRDIFFQKAAFFIQKKRKNIDFSPI